METTLDGIAIFDNEEPRNAKSPIAVILPSVGITLEEHPTTTVPVDFSITQLPASL